jgi:hypothetical protein
VPITCRQMFDGRRRPKGLEFASCERCNQGTAKAGLVASLLGRCFPDSVTESQIADFQKVLRAVRNNIPGLLEEMDISDEGQVTHRSRTGIIDGGGFLNVGGPLVSEHMQAFAIKLGFALHYEATKENIPPWRWRGRSVVQQRR